MPLSETTQIGVLGAGAMGTGIAQVAATAGHRVVIVDSYAPSLERARAGLEKALAREVEKGRLSADQARDAGVRIRYVPGNGEDLSAFKDCGLIIEAIVEELDAKQRAFRTIESVVSESCVLATNTSSLSVGALGAACKRPERVIGLHFFNPAPVLPLVEVIAAITSDPAVAEKAGALVAKWGKTTVRAADTPGFIVNRVARPFYGEALRIHDEGIADIPTIDWAMKELGGFRMGPFELMDLIGNDVNYAVTKSVFEAFYYDPRYRPSLTQRRMVEAGRLGRKTGVGYYDYREGAANPSPKMDRTLGATVMDRVVAMLINEAADAVQLRVASPRDIDLAMTKGVNYPKGLLAWADEIGLETVQQRLVALQEEYGEDRYRPSPLLKRMVTGGRKFFE
ncbi:MAG TPA: 3-hydroxyacyl-CoA dehydrogenase NAD-binding domain-containing protein [Gemmatimonadaceae bacterium]|nr:3-hydroxyacyl-CoA dehydrogenase NAD-binding domain-containing protein [Gemmatimonadaceae bacterium]